MSLKRSAAELDPDYEDFTEQESKRQRKLEQDAKEATVRKIERILNNQFDQEIEYKKSELDLIDQRLNQAQTMLDKLRACIIANYYSRTSQNKYGGGQEVPFIHPTVKKHLGKAPRAPPSENNINSKPGGAENNPENKTPKSNDMKIDNKTSADEVETKTGMSTSSTPVPVSSSTPVNQDRASRFKIKKRIVVGNVCKYIPVDKREGNDQATHKWMVYVRGSREEPNIDHFVKKVWFFLHPSYRPNDLVEVSQPPFHLTRRGWGEFPIRVQLHFHDSRNKKIDIVHPLKLDRTYTGLQTLGRESVVDIELERDSLHESLALRHGKSSGSPRVKRTQQESCSSTPRSTPTPNQAVLGSPLSQEKSPVAMIIQPVTPDPSPSPQPISEGVKGFVTPTKRNGGATGWTHLQIKSEPSSPVPNVVQTPPPKGLLDDVIVEGFTKGVKTEPISPRTPTSRRVSQSPTIVTPGKNVPGWTHLQIKSEPTSPVPGVVGSGWQSISNLTTPPKVTLPSPSPKSATPAGSPAFKPVTMQIGSIGSKTGSSNAKTDNVDVVTAANVSTPTINISNPNFKIGDGVISGDSQSQVMQFQISQSEPNTTTSSQSDIMTQSPAKQGGSLLVVHGAQGGVSSDANIKTPAAPPKSAATTPNQSTIYVKCIDNQGKIYLIPQHLLTKSPATTVSPSTTVSSQVRTQTPVIMGSPQMKGQGQLVTGTSQARGQAQIVFGSSSNVLANVVQKPGQRMSSQVVYQTVTPPATAATSLVAKPTVMTTPGKQTAGGATTQVILQMSPGQGQASKVAIPVAANMLLQMPSTTASKVGTTQALRSVVTSAGLKALTATTSASQVLTSPASSGAEGGNLVGVPGKQSLVLMGPDGKPTSVLPTTQTAKTGAVSLLGPRKMPAQGAQLRPTGFLSQGGASVLQKAGTSLVSAAGTKQPGQVMFVHGGVKGQSLLTNKLTGPRPQSIVNPAGAQSLLTTTVGNQTVILQLLPEQQQALSKATTKASTAGPASNGLSQSLKSPALPTAVSKEPEKTIIPKPNQKPNSLLKKTEEAKWTTAKKEVQRKILYQDYKIEDFDSIEKLVRSLVSTYPLVCENIDRTFHYYATSSSEEYLSWNVGKRRACEWQRASAIRKRIKQLLGNMASFHGDKIWSVKEIMIWCRAHSYTPLDKETSRKLTHEIRPLQSSGIQISTYSEAQGLLQDVTNKGLDTGGRCTQDQDDEDNDIDIISVNDVSVVKLKVESPVKTEIRPQILPSTREADLIQDITSEIGVRLRPVEIDVADCHGLHGNLTHELILFAMKSFAEDIIRTATSVIYQENRVVDEVSVGDVHKALVAMDTCDFLTSRYMGVPKTDKTAS